MQIGQAIRIALLDGLHTELPGNELGTQTVTRCRNLWWTLYVMDRHVSSSLGLPMTTQDSDITTELNPSRSRSRPDATLSLHVKLSYLFSTILTCKSSWHFAPTTISHLPTKQSIKTRKPSWALSSRKQGQFYRQWRFMLGRSKTSCIRRIQTQWRQCPKAHGISPCSTTR